MDPVEPTDSNLTLRFSAALADAVLLTLRDVIDMTLRRQGARDVTRQQQLQPTLYTDNTAW